MKIRMFNAGNGDCILIQSPTTNILIDGGTAGSFSNWYEHVKQLGRIDALFITHIDSDHTNGIIKLLEMNKDDSLEIKSIYFNGIKQLFSDEFGNLVEDSEMNDKFDSITAGFEEVTETENIGFDHGTSLSYILNDMDNTNSSVMHNQISGNPIKIGDFYIEIISPSIEHLNKLKESWKEVLLERQVKKRILTKNHLNAFETYVNSLNKEISKASKVSADSYFDIEEYADSEYEPDLSLANATSLALLIKSSDKSFLMLGDAHIETVIDWMKENELFVDALKVSHHGSKSNLNKEFLGLLNCNKYLISTNGNIYGHPDFETLSRIAKYSKKLETTIFINNNIQHITQEKVDMFKDYKNKTLIKMGEEEITL